MAVLYTHPARRYPLFRSPDASGAGFDSLENYLAHSPQFRVTGVFYARNPLRVQWRGAWDTARCAGSQMAGLSTYRIPSPYRLTATVTVPSFTSGVRHG
ncbi:hypothetical protein MishRS11D_12560 [Methylomagnum ishizawai]|nr:hypothetical protein MishRS11D_12560 [Methylomagnum ishizawai]